MGREGHPGGAKEGFGSERFRHVLGRYPTGVCAITSIDDGQPVGMIVGSFSSASLVPPLVAFFPDEKSTTWPRIERSRRFCVNVLSEHQQEVCRALSSKHPDKFCGISFDILPSGMPVVHGAVAWIDCVLHAVHEAGDHKIVLGKVEDLDAIEGLRPLLFFQGGYHGLANH